MPQKAKDSSSEWNKCTKCCAILHFKDLSTHKSECHDGGALSHGHVIGSILMGKKFVWVKKLTGLLPQGVMLPGKVLEEKDRRLLVLVIMLKKVGSEEDNSVDGARSEEPNIDFAKDFDDALDKGIVPVRQRDQVLLLHPNTMLFCGFSIGGQCIVAKSEILTTWPCSSVYPSGIGLSESTATKIGCSKGSIISVEHFSDSLQSAGEITMTPCSEMLDVFKDENFMHYLRKREEGRYIRPGNEIHMAYFGQNFLFKVQNIICTNSKKKLFNIEKDTVNAHLVESFTDLSIAESDTSVCNTSSPCLSNYHIDTSLDTYSKEYNASTPKHDYSYRNKPSDLGASFEEMQYQKSGVSSNSNESSIQEEHSSKFTPNKTPITPVKEDSITSPGDDQIKDAVNRTFCTPVRYTGESNASLSNMFYKVTSSTKFIIVSKDSEQGVEVKESIPSIKYDDLGGLKSQIETLKDFIHLPIQSPDMFKIYGLPKPRGILVFGPSGCGKSYLVQAVVSELDIHCVTISGPEIWSKFYGETEQKLRSLFQEAKQRSPSLIVIDNIDSLCPRRESTNSDLERRVVASFLTLMDGISETRDAKFVMVLGTTSKPDSIDPALRRPGRFDKEIEIGVPSSLDRREILERILCKCQTDITPDEIAAIADAAHGYVGADLVALVKEASLSAIKYRSGDNNDILKLRKSDLENAMNIIQPSAMREVQIEVPKVYWNEIGGQDEIKLKLKQAVEWPLTHPEAFDRMGISPPKGILMYGPPGCSKTMIAKALATESGLNFLAVKGPELFSKWVGESERAVREVFRKARSAAPSIIFFDEIDALAIERGSSSGGSNVADRVLAQLLTEIDGVEKLKDVTIVAATNRPDMIDKALLRPGRIDRILYVPLPDDKTRCEIFKIKLSKIPVSPDVTAEWLAKMTEGYTGAEITSICHEAAMYALQEDINSQSVFMSHFENAIKTVKPRISRSMLDFYENYHKSSGLHNI